MSQPVPRPRDTLVYHAFRGFLAIGSRLPLGLTRPLGAAVGALYLRLSARDRRRARDHLRIAFPELDDGQVRDLLRRNARHLGKLLAEVTWLWRASADQVEAMVSLVGMEHVDHALEEGGGGILTTGHCGNWELLNARASAAGIPVTGAVRDIDDPRLARIATTLRSRFGSEVVARGHSAGRKAAHALKRNRMVGLLIDQDIRDIPGVFVPFFGRPAWTPSGAASLALQLGCPIMPGFIHRRPDNSHHFEVLPPLSIPEQGSMEDRVLELTAAATAAIEDQIRAHPEQWVWLHRRWRRQPPPDQ